MKEQDYMNIMSSIRGEYLEEAVSWDGSERRRIRQIRRMTVSFGAVAAALAVVVGMIAYKANKDKIDTAHSDTESSMVDAPETTENLYGGHGALRQMTGNYGTVCYDDENVYSGDAKWSVKSGGKVTYMDENPCKNGLYMDGKHLLRLHDGKIFETDSFGKETELIDIEAFQFPMQIDPERIVKLRKLSDRLLCIDYNEDAQYPTLLIADLANRVAYQQENPTSCMLFPDGETSYYGFSPVTKALTHYELKTGSLTEEPLWMADEAYFDCSAAAVQNGCLYLTAKKNDGSYENPNDAPERYMVVELGSGRLRTDAVLAPDARCYVGKAFYAAEIKNGVFCLYRNDLDDSEDEKLVYSVPVDQYYDTERYGMPDMAAFLGMYESDDLIIVYLPMTSDGIPRPSKHGEDGAMIDLKTEKVLYFGENYNYSTPDDSSSSAEVTVTTAVSGGGTDTGVTGTAVSGTAAETTAKTAAQTTGAPALTAADGSNIFGGKGALTWLCGDYWADSAYVYSSDGSRFTYHSEDSVMLNYLGDLCDKKDCRHDSESCPAYHFNMRQSHPDSTDYVRNGKVEMPLHCSGDTAMWMQRGNDLYRVNMENGTETQMFRITQINGMTVGADDLYVRQIVSVTGAGGTATGKYLVTGSVGLNVPGVDPDATYMILADTVSDTQKLVAQPGPEGVDNAIGVLLAQGSAADGNFYSVKDSNVIIQFDGSFTNKKEYRLPEGELVQNTELCCVHDHVFWFKNTKEQWCSYDLNTGAFRAVRENVPVCQYEAYAPVLYWDGMFFAIRSSEDGYSRTILMFRYDWANSEEHHIQNITPLIGLWDDVRMSGNTCYVPFSTQDGTGILVTDLPEWAPRG
ncbi:MAG: hypothetical protein IKH27_02525 [Oscillospiraceae bacterium]|nr:hypothetical protein [Oscillospiraceae bacterium]